MFGNRNSIFIILTVIVSCIIVLLCSRNDDHYMFLAESIFPRWTILKAGFIMSKYVQIIQESSIEQNLELIGTFFEEPRKTTICVSQSTSKNENLVVSSTKEQLSTRINTILEFIFMPIKNIQYLKGWLVEAFKFVVTGLKTRFIRQQTTKISMNDHVEVDIATIPNLSPDQIHLIMDTYFTLCSNVTLTNSSNCPITPHMVFRYYAATDWAKSYNGKRFVFKETILFMMESNFNLVMLTLSRKLSCGESILK